MAPTCDWCLGAPYHVHSLSLSSFPHPPPLPHPATLSRKLLISLFTLEASRGPILVISCRLPVHKIVPNSGQALPLGLRVRYAKINIPPAAFLSHSAPIRDYPLLSLHNKDPQA